MGGPLKRYELVSHNVLLTNIEAVQRFHACGWLGYFLQLTKFNEEVAMDFMMTFDEGEASVLLLRVISTKERMAKVIGLSKIVEHYPNKHDAKSSRAQFT